MTFPLFRRPGTVVFLDDDPDYLDMLALVLPRNWRVLLFLRPQECINYLQQEPPVWETDAWNQQQLIDLELRQALGRTSPPELNPAFLIGREQSLLGALFNIEPEFAPDPSASYNSWLARQDRRSVRN